MSFFRRIRLIGPLALVLTASMAPVCVAQLRPQPELLRRLWPFGRVQRPAGQLVQPSEPLKQKQPEKRRLIAPFVTPSIDVNNCTLLQLQNLPGVNASTAARIFAGRPYRSYDDLERDGVPLNVVEGLRGKITFGR